MATWRNATSTGRTGATFEKYVAPDEFSLPTPSGSDDSEDIQELIDLATVSGGEVVLGAGTYLASGLLIKSDVVLRGKGTGATVLKLSDSADEDLITVADFATLAAGTTTGGPSGWGLRDLTLDGNTTNNSSGWTLRVYAFKYTIDNVEIKEGASGGVWSQWGTGGTDMEAHWSNFRIHDCDGTGLDWNGPHDSRFVNGLVFKNTGVGIHTAAQATGDQFTNVHTWGTEHTYGWHLEAPAYCVNCISEGAATANVVLDVNFGSWIGGSIFGTNNGAEVGLQLGLNATARYWTVKTFLYNFAATGKPINYVSSNVNDIDVNVNSGACTTLVAGSPAHLDSLRVFCGDAPAKAVTASDTVPPKVFGDTHIYSAADTRGIILGAQPNEHYIDILESTTVNSSVANGARIQARDNGSGKTQLVVRFQSGVVQVIATEP